MSAEMSAFVRVVEQGSFAAAAQDLSLTASAVSKIVTRVEQRLGVQLLTRTTRRIALTAEGETSSG
jgi:DNA-binding transcriptional LysR family regulator